jgi:hypothetical protein
VFVGLNPGTVYWMVVSNTSYYNGKIMKKKEAKWGKQKKPRRLQDDTAYVSDDFWTLLTECL